MCCQRLSNNTKDIKKEIYRISKYLEMECSKNPISKPKQAGRLFKVETCHLFLLSIDEKLLRKKDIGLIYLCKFIF